VLTPNSLGRAQRALREFFFYVEYHSC
jgi:hypothetical protein